MRLRCRHEGGVGDQEPGEVTNHIPGQHIDAKDYTTQKRGIGYLTGPSDFGVINPIVSKWTEFPKVKARKGDILITVKGSGVGKINLLDQDGVAISRQLMAVRVTKANPHYIYAFLSSTFDHFQSESTGAAIPGISREQVLGLRITTPPLPEQQRIVGILDEAFGSIATAKANAEKNLQNARALFESHLQSIFTQRGEGWIEKKLRELYSFKNGINFDKTQKTGRGIFTVDVLNMYGDDLQLNLDNIYRVDKEVTGEYILKTGDILVVRSSVKREGVGWAKTFIETSEPITFCGFIIRGRPLTEMLPEYSVYFLRCQTTRDELIQRATQSTITNINQFNLGELVVPIPPLQEQKQIVDKLDTLREDTQRLESIYQKKLTALDALKKSLLDQAFTGQL